MVPPPGAATAAPAPLPPASTPPSPPAPAPVAASLPTAPGDLECVALAEIELCGDLIIAASAVDGERLSDDRIDEVLRVGAHGRR